MISDTPDFSSYRECLNQTQGTQCTQFTCENEILLSPDEESQESYMESSKTDGDLNFKLPKFEEVFYQAKLTFKRSITVQKYNERELNEIADMLSNYKQIQTDGDKANNDVVANLKDVAKMEPEKRTSFVQDNLK